MSDIVISPGTSIQTTINNALPGDRILLTPGAYNSDNSLNINKSITIESQVSGTFPEVRLNGSTYSYILTISANNVTIDGLDINNLRAGGMNSGYITTTGSINNLTIKNCKIREYRRFYFPNPIDGLNILNCHIHRTRGQSIDMYNAKNVQIKYNWIDQSSTTGEGAINFYSTGDCGITEFSYNYILAHRIGIEIAALNSLNPSNGSILVSHNTIDVLMVNNRPDNPFSQYISTIMGFSFWNNAGGILNADRVTIRDCILSRITAYSVYGNKSISGRLTFQNCLFYDPYWYYWPNYRQPYEYFVFLDKPIFCFGGPINNIYTKGCFFNINPEYVFTGTEAHQFYALKEDSPAKNAATDGTHIGAWQGVDNSGNPILGNPGYNEILNITDNSKLINISKNRLKRDSKILPKHLKV
jgi:hypothetical protein